MSATYALEGRIVTITLRGEDERNRLTAEMAMAIDRHLARFDADPDARVAILTGHGPHFCGGAEENLSPADLAIGHRPTKPVIAAVAGDCLGEGLVLLGRVSDECFAGQSSRFGFDTASSGFGGAAAVRSRLYRKIPYTALMWLLATGERFDAAAALRVGLVDEVVPDGDVVARARAEAATVAAFRPRPVRNEMRAIMHGEDRTDDDASFYGSLLRFVGKLIRNDAESVSYWSAYGDRPLAQDLEKRKPSDGDE